MISEDTHKVNEQVRTHIKRLAVHYHSVCLDVFRGEICSQEAQIIVNATTRFDRITNLGLLGETLTTAHVLISRTSTISFLITSVTVAVAAA